MQPVRMELKGFTAFRDEQVLDFDGLDLFAIAGPTGSGKSSLLDAMTFALFGYVDRVGKQVSRLVSQGQPRMAVKLEFRVGEQRFRVTRSTPAARGATKILLERFEGGAWRQAGEGADRVREVEAMVEKAIGLDYDAFTRSVLLPQGKFAEFLVGDARDRRAILTELLGLELFERLARRAGELKRDAIVAAEANERLLATEYAGVTDEAVAEAELAAKSAAARDEALGAAEAKVRDIADRWAETARSVKGLAECADEARQIAELAVRAGRSLEELADELAAADAGSKEAAKAQARAAKDETRAKAALSKAETSWSRSRDLLLLRPKAERLVDLREEIAAAEAELETARQAAPGLQEAFAAAEQLVKACTADAEAAIVALSAARTALDEATHADLVSAVRAGLRVGDACPVCGHKIASLPKSRRAQTLEKARAMVAKAEIAASTANDALRHAQTTRSAAERGAEDADREAGRIEKELALRRDRFSGVEAELIEAFGVPLPRDPLAVLDDRLEQLESLSKALDEAGAAASGARQEAVEAERARDALAASVGEVSGRLRGLAVSGLLDRARSAGGTDPPIRDLPTVPETQDPSALSVVAAALADSLASLAARLDDVAASRAAAERGLLDEAQTALGDLVELMPTLEEQVEAVAEARTRAARGAATAEHHAGQLRAKLENTRTLVEQVAAQRLLSERFGALASELRADRIIAFLQLEALQVLAAAGSEHLRTLSAGRYRLEYEGEEFFVIDTWNGEESRSARTLSGGETFLASLGLALALAEHVQALAVTAKARMESLFLDEGFGTLDPETLETVVEAIEQLGGDGRMVGVITHVQELAIRMPTRIDIQKSPRGSRVQTVR